MGTPGEYDGGGIVGHMPTPWKNHGGTTAFVYKGQTAELLSSSVVQLL